MSELTIATSEPISEPTASENNVPVPVVVKHPKIDAAIERLNAAIRAELSVPESPDVQTLRAVLSNIPDTDMLRAARASIQVQIDELTLDSEIALLATIRDYLTPKLRDYVHMPEPCNHSASAPRASAPRASAPRASAPRASAPRTSDDLRSADGVLVAVTRYSRETIAKIADDSAPCEKIGCGFCEIASKADSMRSYGGYKSALNRRVQSTSAQEIADHYGCIVNVALCGLDAFESAVLADVYTVD